MLLRVLATNKDYIMEFLLECNGVDVCVHVCVVCELETLRR